jgi:ribosomal-protein-alanine N-acetyltransferase
MALTLRASNPPPGVIPAATLVPTGSSAQWNEALPMLCGASVVLRELRRADAPSLLALTSDARVTRFLAPPPETLAGVEAFIAWARAKRADGTFASFAIVPRGTNTAVGFFQIRALGEDFETAEWGFALCRAYWGSGLFAAGAAEMLAFAFDHLGVRRLEARAMCQNGRANGALRKMGAIPEGRLRRALPQFDERRDTNLWSILDTDWRARHGDAVVPLVVPGRAH